MADPAVTIIMEPGALAAALPGLGAATHLVLRGRVVAADLALLATREATPALTSLALIGTGLTPDDLSPLLDSALLAGLTELDLTNGALGDDGIAALVGSAACAGLTGLAVGLNQLSDVAVSAIAGSAHLARLERLSLGDAALSDDFAPPAEAALVLVPRPVTVSERFASSFHPAPNRLTAASMTVLGEATTLPALRELSLWALPFGGAGIAALVATPLLARLTALDLRNVAIDPATSLQLTTALERIRPLHLRGIALAYASPPLLGLPILAAIPAVTASCPSLWFGGNCDDAEVEAMLAALRRFGALTSLTIPDQPMLGARTGALAEVVAGLPRLHGLRARVDGKHIALLLATLDDRAVEQLHLTIDSMHSAGGLARLLAWPGLRAVTDLGLGGPVEDDGVAALVASAQLGRPTRLCLFGCGLTDRGLRALLGCAALADLEILELGDNQLSLAGIHLLADALATAFPRLRQLGLYGNPIGWVNEEWYDWDGSVVGGEVKTEPAARDALRRIPATIELGFWDPR